MSKREQPPRSTLEAGLDGLTLKDVSLDTAAVTARLHFTGTRTEPLVPAICHSSTYILEKVEDFLGALTDGGFVYSRLSNQTGESAECAINALEQGAGSLVFSSGMGAVSAILFGFLKTGDHVICQNPVYSGTMSLLKQMQASFNIEVTWVKAGTSVEEYKRNLKGNTKMLIGETPCNPELSILDLAAFGALGRSLENVVTVVDCTFASPYLQQALKHGIDISMHSCTKYMGGHSDMIAGCVTTRTVEQWRLLKKMQGSIGACLSPHDASLLLRGLKTLPLRMRKHSENALRLAEFLEAHPKVLRVSYPGLASHPGHAVAQQQMTAFGGMIMADVAGGVAGGKMFVESLKLGKLAVSLGGVETIVEHVYTMSHGPYLLSAEEIKEAGVTPGMVRISVGIEDCEDLLKDFAQALDKVQV